MRYFSFPDEYKTKRRRPKIEWLWIGIAVIGFGLLGFAVWCFAVGLPSWVLEARI